MELLRAFESRRPNGVAPVAALADSRSRDDPCRIGVVIRFVRSVLPAHHVRDRRDGGLRLVGRMNGMKGIGGIDHTAARCYL